MLVLTRKIDEQIKIGDDITITVIKLRNNQIRLGIEAPRDVRVLRAELEDKKPVQASTSIESAQLAPAVQSKSPQSRIRNEVIDGLVSADEMIAKALPDAETLPSTETRLKADGYSGDLPNFSETHAGNLPGKAPLKIFSGRVRAKQTEDAGTLRAPLSDYFSAT